MGLGKSIGLGVLVAMAEGACTEAGQVDDNKPAIVRDASFPDAEPVDAGPPPIKEFTKIDENNYRIGDGEAEIIPSGRDFYNLIKAPRIYVTFDDNDYTVGADWDESKGAYILEGDDHDGEFVKKGEVLRFKNGKGYKIVIYPEENKLFAITRKIKQGAEKCAGVFKNGTIDPETGLGTLEQENGDYEQCEADDTRGKVKKVPKGKGGERPESRFRYKRVANGQVKDIVIGRGSVHDMEIADPEVVGGQMRIFAMEGILGTEMNRGAVIANSQHYNKACCDKAENMMAMFIEGREGDHWKHRGLKPDEDIGPTVGGLIHNFMTIHGAIESVLEAKNRKLGVPAKPEVHKSGSRKGKDRE